MKENIIVAGHFLAKYESRRKYSDICNLEKNNYHFVYITPISEYSEIAGTYKTDTEYTTINDTLEKLNTYISNPKKHWLYLHNPISLLRIFRKYKPRLLIIENEPHSFLTVELFFTFKIYSFLKGVKSKIIIFSWDNIYLTNKIPKLIYKKLIDYIVTLNLYMIICGNKKCYYNFIKRGVRKDKLKQFPQVGIDTKNIKNFDSNPINKKEISLIYCGRLVPEKGIHILIKSNLLLNKKGFNIKTTIAGNGYGTYFEYLKSLKNNQKSIEFIPALSKMEMYKAFSESTFFVLPSLTTKKWVEQFGLTLAEAMASKNCLALGSSSGAIPEVISFNECIFKENSVNSLTTLIIYFINNSKIRSELSKKQSEYAVLNYSFKAIAECYRVAISEALTK